MLKEVAVSWQDARRVWWMRENFVAQFLQLLKRWLWGTQSGVVMGKSWALSVDQCWVQVLRFLVHFIHLLSILLRCNGFAGVRYSGSDWQQTTKKWPWLFLVCKFGFGKCFGASSQSNHWDGRCGLLYKIHFLIACQNTIRDSQIQRFSGVCSFSRIISSKCLCQRGIFWGGILYSPSKSGRIFLNLPYHPLTHIGQHMCHTHCESVSRSVMSDSLQP